MNIIDKKQPQIYKIIKLANITSQYHKSILGQPIYRKDNQYINIVRLYMGRLISIDLVDLSHNNLTLHLKLEHLSNSCSLLQ